MALPDAWIYPFDAEGVRWVAFVETEHYRIHAGLHDGLPRHGPEASGAGLAAIKLTSIGPTPLAHCPWLTGILNDEVSGPQT